MEGAPLDGVWANGTPAQRTVPSLYLLLSPQSDRPSTFYVGSKEFDPVNVGFSTAQMKGASKFDTSLPGNGKYAMSSGRASENQGRDRPAVDARAANAAH